MISSVEIAANKKYKEELNDLWNIIDPDVGGRKTWKEDPSYSFTGDSPVTHFLIVTPLEEETYEMFTGDYNEYEIAEYIRDLATERDREKPDWFDDSSKLEGVINSIIVEPENLKEVKYA